jgi:hypothetical protein
VTPQLPALTAEAWDFADVAMTTLSEEPLRIRDAEDRVPPKPGLYAIYAPVKVAANLGLIVTNGTPLYVGKAERSLAGRDLGTHFATNRTRAARTGGSTVRRSFAALLRDELALQAVPRNANNPDGSANYALTPEGDDRLTDWMHDNLSLAVWPAPQPLPVPLRGIEKAVIWRWAPPINLTDVPQPNAYLRALRAEMTNESRA